jgi:hypothetical protein
MNVCETSELGSIEITPDSTIREGARGAPVRLADGAEWLLSYPTTRYKPEFTGDVAEPIKILTLWGYPPNVEADLLALSTAMRETPEVVALRLLFRTLSGLLRLCHEITPTAACELMTCESSDLQRYFEAINAAVKGDPAESAEVAE